MVFWQPFSVSRRHIIAPNRRVEGSHIITALIIGLFRHRTSRYWCRYFSPRSSSPRRNHCDWRRPKGRATTIGKGRGLVKTTTN